MNTGTHAKLALLEPETAVKIGVLLIIAQFMVESFDRDWLYYRNVARFSSYISTS